MENVTVLLPDGCHLPPHLERFAGLVVEGTRACRKAGEELEVIVCEGFRDKNGQFFPASSSDVLDPRVLRGDAVFIVHLRPHRDPDDVPSALPAESLHIL